MHYFSLRSFLLCLAAATIFMAPVAEAITIDEFNGDIFVIANVGSTAQGAESLPSAIGGHRTLEVAAAGSISALHVAAGTFLGQYSHSQDDRVTGSSLLIWDGDNNPATLNPTGLGGVNFTQDGSTAFQFQINSFDFPNAKSVDLIVTVYSSATEHSSAKLTLSSAIISSTNLNLPFASFVKDASATAPANFLAVGAIRLLVDGNNAPAADLSFDWFGTDQCRLIPNEELSVVDECQVCGGDNSSCADCTGVPNGPNVPGADCANQEQGVCDGGSYNQSCQCVRKVQPSAEICDGIDNNCDGSVDESFAGLGQPCLVGTAPCEANGINVCTNAGGMVCNASSSIVESCEASKGCDGNPGSGLVPDICGICGGDGRSCLDCKGALNGPAKVDNCGVCGGDDSSCIECTEEDISPIQVLLDNGAIGQDELIQAIVKKLWNNKKNPSLQKFVKATLRKAEDLHLKNWVLTWTRIPSISKTCDNKLLCQSFSNLPALDEYRARSEELRQLAYETVRRLEGSKAKNGKLSRSGRAFLRYADKNHASNLELTNRIPVTYDSCQ